MPITVTVCGTFQSTGVNVRYLVTTPTSPGSDVVISSTTVATMGVASATVKASLVLVSRTTVGPPLSSTTSEGVSSSSTVVTDTVRAGKTSKASGDCAPSTVTLTVLT